MEKIRAAAMSFFNDAKLTEAWLSTPFPTFDNKTPVDYANDETGERYVLDYLESINPNSKKPQ